MNRFDPNHGHLSRGGVAPVISVIVLCHALAFFGSARADILEMIPQDAVGLISFRSLNESNERFSQILKKIDPSFEGLPLADLESTLGFAPGTIDLSKRISVVLFHPDEIREFVTSPGLGAPGSGGYPVVAFTPRRAESFAGLKNRVRARQGIWSKYYALSRDGTVFISDRRKPLRSLMRVRRGESLAARMNSHHREIYESDDAFLHFPAAAWRERLNPMLTMMGTMVKINFAAHQTASNSSDSRETLDWFIEGALDAIDQMDFLSISLRINSETVRLHHVHTFDRNRSVAEYLKDVTRSGDEPWRALPDKPFLALGYYDWQCPVEKSLTVHMLRKIHRLPYVPSKKWLSVPSDEESLRAIKATLECARDLKLADFAFTNPTGELLPFEIAASYTTDDALKMLELFVASQESSHETWSNFLAGGVGFSGTFKHARQNGLDVREMSFDDKTLPGHALKEIHDAYGPEARFQLAAGGKNHLLYSLAQPPAGVADLARSLKSGKSIADNPRVRRARALLPADANVVLILDMDRLMTASQNWVEHGVASAGRAKFLLGWSCRVSDNMLDCEFAADATELVRFFGAKTGKGKIAGSGRN